MGHTVSVLYHRGLTDFCSPASALHKRAASVCGLVQYLSHFELPGGQVSTLLSNPELLTVLQYSNQRRIPAVCVIKSTAFIHSITDRCKRIIQIFSSICVPKAVIFSIYTSILDQPGPLSTGFQVRPVNRSLDRSIRPGILCPVGTHESIFLILLCSPFTCI